MIEVKPREFDVKATIKAAQEMVMQINPHSGSSVTNNPADAYQAGFIRGARFNHEHVKLIEYEAYQNLMVERDKLAAELDAAKAEIAVYKMAVNLAAAEGNQDPKRFIAIAIATCAAQAAAGVLKGDIT